MKRLVVLVLLLSVLFIPAFVNAEDQLLKPGTWEVGVGLESESLATESNPALVPFIGYFFTDNIEGIIYAYYSNMEADDSILGKIEVSKTRVSGGIVYNFRPLTIQNTRLVPAISGLIDYVSAEGEGSSISQPVTSLDSLGFTIGLGIRCFVGSRGSINLENYYSTADADLEYNTAAGVVTATEDVSGFNTSISYSLYFH